MSYGNSRQVSGNSLEDFLRGLTNLHVAVPLMFIMIFLWLNGSEMWGATWEAQTAEAYIIMFGFVLAITFRSKLIWLNKTNLKEGVMNFWIGFLMMFAGMVVLSQYLMKGSFDATISSTAVYPAIAITAFYVAPVEETIFRGVLKEYFKGLKLYFVPLGIILTSGAFAITHYAVYGGVGMSLLWAFIMGCVFYLLTEFKPSKRFGQLGVPGAIGAHACYNLFILGILSGGIV
jgi:hypothetical protein